MLQYHKYVKKKIQGLSEQLIINNGLRGRGNKPANWWFLHIHDFNNKHVVPPYNDTISNIF